MTQIKVNKVKKEMEVLSSGHTSTDTQNIFYDIVFKKKVEERIEEAGGETLTYWKEYPALAGLVAEHHIA